MSSYIDADALIERWDNMSVRGRTEFDQEIMRTPHIDIVRCAECKYEPICTHTVQHTTHKPTSVTIEYKTVEWCSYGDRKERVMIVHYDEEHFSIKLYRDFVKGKLVGLMEVIPIDELLEVWEKHKAEQTEPTISKMEQVEQTEPNSSEKPNNCKDEPQTDCAWK